MELSLNFVRNICPNKTASAATDRTPTSCAGSVSMPFETEVVESAANLPQEWNVLATSESLLLHSDYLSSVETPSGQYYVLFRCHGELKGIAYFQVADFRSRPLGDTLEQKNFFVSFLARQFRLLREPLHYRLLVCGNCFATGEHGFAFAPGTPDKDISTALREAANLLMATNRTMKRKISGILFKDFHPHRVHEVMELEEGKYIEFPSEPNLVLNLDPSWKTLDDYTDSMLSKYRVKANRAYTKSEALEVRDMTAQDLEEHRDRLSELYHEVVDKADFRVGDLDPLAFGRLKENMGKDFLFKGFFLEGKPVGFMTGFFQKEILEAHLVGIDYEMNYEHSIYPRMLYEYVEEAIKAGVKAVSFGRTAGEIKTTVGADPVPLVCYLRHRKNVSNQFLKVIMKNIRPEEFPIRKAFKKDWYDEQQNRTLNPPIPTPTVQN